MNTSSKKENSKPLIVGLTGGIGSGKSTVAKVFKALNVPVFNSDEVAKSIINKNAEVVKQVIDAFGDVYENGELNREKIARIVFNDKESLEKLNDIIHPKVGEYFEAWKKENDDAPMLLKEAAILIESGAHEQVDKIILVMAPKDLRIQRVVERDNVDSAEVNNRIKAQLSDEEKKTYADFVIINDGVEMILPQVLAIYNQLKKP